jgi:hypothetical protein
MAKLQSNAKIQAANKALDTLLVKANRAHKHVSDLDKALNAFFDTDPYGGRREDDADARECRFYVSKMTDIPLPISGIIGDVLQNLRSALDHLAHHLVIKNRQTPTRHTCFPIADDATNYLSAAFRRKVKGMSKTAEKAIDALQPYKTGNDVFWRLHVLSIADKHRTLIPIAVGLTGHSVQVNNVVVFVGPGKPIAPLKIGDALLTVPINEAQDHMKFKVDVVFNEPGVLADEPIVEALNEMVQLVIGVIIDFSTKKLL